LRQVITQQIADYRTYDIQMFLMKNDEATKRYTVKTLLYDKAYPGMHTVHKVKTLLYDKAYPGMHTVHKCDK